MTLIIGISYLHNFNSSCKVSESVHGYENVLEVFLKNKPGLSEGDIDELLVIDSDMNVETHWVR
jgi:hypothetical protein